MREAAAALVLVLGSVVTAPADAQWPNTAPAASTSQPSASQPRPASTAGGMGYAPSGTVSDTTAPPLPPAAQEVAPMPVAMPLYVPRVVSPNLPVERDYEPSDLSFAIAPVIQPNFFVAGPMEGAATSAGVRMVPGGSFAIDFRYLLENRLAGINFGLFHFLGAHLGSTGGLDWFIEGPQVHFGSWFWDDSFVPSVGGSALGLSMKSCGGGSFPFYVQVHGPQADLWVPVVLGNMLIGNAGLKSFSSIGFAVEAGILVF